MKKILLYVLSLTCFYASYAQKIVPDPSFGNKGIVVTSLGATTASVIYASQLLPSKTGDGKVCVVLNDEFNSFVTRRLQDGSLDLTYGINGYSQKLFRNALAALQKDEKIILVLS